MKKIFILFCVIGFISCSDNNEIDDKLFSGNWTLTNVSCFCGFPDPPEFELTQLTVRTNLNEISVVNSGSQVYFRENGTYAYSQRDNRITFDDGEAFDVSFKGDTLQLVFVDRPGIADDEVTYFFVIN